jgi:hypothetical protein
MTFITAFALALIAYVVVGATGVLAVQALFPIPPGGGTLVSDGPEFSLFLAAQSVACFSAGVVAVAASRARPGMAIVIVGGPLFALTTVATAVFWSAMPAVYNASVIVITPVFFCVGTAWFAAVRSRRSGEAS